MAWDDTGVAVLITVTPTTTEPAKAGKSDSITTQLAGPGRIEHLVSVSRRGLLMVLRYVWSGHRRRRTRAVYHWPCILLPARDKTRRHAQREMLPSVAVTRRATASPGPHSSSVIGRRGGYGELARHSAGDSPGARLRSRRSQEKSRQARPTVAGQITGRMQCSSATGVHLGRVHGYRSHGGGGGSRAVPPLLILAAHGASSILVCSYATRGNQCA